MLSVVSPHEPATAKLLASNIRMQLVKRTRLYDNNGKTDTRDILLSSGEFQGITETTEGVTLLRGTIKAGSAGRESSWQIEGTIEVQVSARRYGSVLQRLRMSVVCHPGAASASQQCCKLSPEFYARRNH
jgi:hypothetical protein